MGVERSGGCQVLVELGRGGRRRRTWESHHFYFFPLLEEAHLEEVDLGCLAAAVQSFEDDEGAPHDGVLFWRCHFGCNDGNLLDILESQR